MEVQAASGDSGLGEILVHVEYAPGGVLRCAQCGDEAPGYDRRTRRWRHLNTMQWKTFIVAEVPRVNCAHCGVKQVRVVWAEERSRFTELFEVMRSRFCRRCAARCKPRD